MKIVLPFARSIRRKQQVDWCTYTCKIPYAVRGCLLKRTGTDPIHDGNDSLPLTAWNNKIMVVEFYAVAINVSSVVEF